MSLKLFTHTAIVFAAASLALIGCGDGSGSNDGTTSDDWAPSAATEKGASEPDASGFVWQTEQFADLKMIRYQVPGWDQLSPKQRALVYCLNQAGLSGRDMMYDQNNRYNLRIRHLLESIYTGFEGDKSTNGWTALRPTSSAFGFPTAFTTTMPTPRLCPSFLKRILLSWSKRLALRYRMS